MCFPTEVPNNVDEPILTRAPGLHWLVIRFRRHQMLPSTYILVLRECTISNTRTCLITDVKLTCLVADLHPLDGPRAVIRVDPAPGFVSLSNIDGLKHLNVSMSCNSSNAKHLMSS